MESDDDFEMLPSSPVVHEQKLKRLKKATNASEHSLPSISPPNFAELENDEHSTESNGGSDPEFKSLGDENVTVKDGGLGDENVTVEERGLGARRVLEFDSEVEELDSAVEELDGNVKEKTEEIEKKSEKFEDPKTDELERKRPSTDVVSEKKKKKKRIHDGDDNEKHKESTSNKRKAEKERQENLKQLRAESQRLLRATRDAAFKPVPLIQKPISSILDKIRQRKLEILKKSNTSFDDYDGSEEPCSGEEITDKIEDAEVEEKTATCPAVTKDNLNESHVGDSNDAADDSNRESIPSPVATGKESEHAFRAPIGDTQELFSDSQISDTKDEPVNEKLDNPSEEMFASSMLPMNLKLDSAPADDDVSSDDEDDDKENIDPHVHGSVGLTSPPSGDPVRAFVDEEAEEEDDSDNDLQRFQDNEEGEDDDDDIEELNDIIETAYEEKPIDREKRDQLHQQWLEKQDTAGMDNLLQKLNCGSKLKESISIEEEDEESVETENESDDEIEDYIAPAETMRINLKKVKQMIPQMYTDKDDAYVSSDDEETEERLAKQSLFYKAEEKAEFFSPAEDESSRGVFSLIKKLNVVPATKGKARTPTIFDMPRIGQNVNLSSKSSFVGRASNHFMPPSQKHGSIKMRSYIFGRDDSNSRTSLLTSEDSSDTIPESQPSKAVSAKFHGNTQNKYTTLNSTSQKSDVSLLEILRKSSLQTERCVENARVQQKESVFDAFKLTKKTETRVLGLP